MRHRRSGEAATSSTHLPIRTHCVLGANGARSVALRVFCPRRAATIPVDVCEHCPRLDAIETGGDAPCVACDPGAERAGLEPVGAIVRPAVLCVHSDVPLHELDPDESGSHVIPVVDESDRYLGAIVQGRSSSIPPPHESDAALLRGHATAEDAMSHVLAVNEGDDIVTAAAAMTSSRARCVAVVNDARVVVGLLDDISLLASAARARAAREEGDPPGEEPPPSSRRRRR